MCTTLYIPNSNVQITHCLTCRCYFLTFKYNLSAYEAVSLWDFNLHLLAGWQCWASLLVAIGWVLCVCSSCLLLRFFSPICFIAGGGPGQAPSLHLLRPWHTLTTPSNHWVVAVLHIFQIRVPDWKGDFQSFLSLYELSFHLIISFEAQRILIMIKSSLFSFIDCSLVPFLQNHSFIQGNGDLLFCFLQSFILQLLRSKIYCVILFQICY